MKAKRLMKDQDRVEMRNRRGKRGRDDPGFLTWIMRQTVEPLTEIWNTEDGAGLGETVPNTVDGLTCPPILPPM